MPTNKNQKAKTSAPKTSKPRKNSKKTEPVVEQVVEPVVPDPVPVEQPVVDQPVKVEPVVDSYDVEFAAITSALKDALTLVKDLTSKVNQLEKRVKRDHKVMEKKMRGRVKRVQDPNKKPSGFAKPGPVSSELGKFIGLEKDELISRTQVTKRITAYCQEHSLQNDGDKRNIQPDAALSKLLRFDSKKDEPLTFFNLQRFMKIHYPDSKNGGAIPANA